MRSLSTLSSDDIVCLSSLTTVYSFRQIDHAQCLTCATNFATAINAARTLLQNDYSKTL